MLVRPFIPNRHAFFAQVANVGVPREKPEELMDDGAGVHLFRRQKWKPCAEVEAHLIAENGQGAGPGAIVLAQSVIAHVAHEIEIGTHGGSPEGGRTLITRGPAR